MEKMIVIPDESLNFETISEFKRSLHWGGEMEFVWNGITYGVIRYGTNNKLRFMWRTDRKPRKSVELQMMH